MSEEQPIMRPTPKYKIGDTVQLNSGGPALTVTRIEWNAGMNWICFCTWIFNGVVQNDYFPEVCLTAWTKG